MILKTKMRILLNENKIKDDENILFQKKYYGKSI